MKRFLQISLLLMMFFSMTSQSASEDGVCGNDITTCSITTEDAFHVGVILVQFSDWETNVDARGSHCQIDGEHNHYTYQDFYRHLFSEGIYTSENNFETHDQEDVFGSMRDFFDENSYNKFTLTGEILNDSTFNETTGQWVPIWVTLSESKQTWENGSLSPTALLNATLSASGFSTSGFDKMIVIYAGAQVGGGLRPATAGVGGFVYQIGEKTGSERGRTQTEGTFYGIGTHCHEMGHFLGLRDFRVITDPDHPRGLNEFALMSQGNQGFMDGNHENNIGGFHAPTQLCGWSKLRLGWADYEEFTEGSVTFPSFEEDDQICVYFINDSNHDNWEEGEYFIFENRRPEFSDGSRTFNGDMIRGATVGGLLVFHHRNSGVFTNGLRLEVIEADNSDAVGTTVASSSMAHFYPGTTSNDEFSADSTPSSDDASGNPSGLALVDITNNDGEVSAIVDFGAPDAPENLAIANAGQDGQYVELEWDANSEADIDHYAIYRGYQDDKFSPVNWLSSPVATTSATTWTDPFVLTGFGTLSGLSSRSGRRGKKVTQESKNSFSAFLRDLGDLCVKK